jgi:hypothetical protein
MQASCEINAKGTLLYQKVYTKSYTLTFLLVLLGKNPLADLKIHLWVYNNSHILFSLVE